MNDIVESKVPSTGTDLFTAEEETIYQGLMSKRLVMLDDMFEDGKPPSDNGSRRVAKELIESAEAAMLRRVELRAKISKDASDAEAKKVLVAATLRALRDKTIDVGVLEGGSPDKLPPAVFEGEVFVPGEADIDKIELHPDEFIGDR